MIRFFSPYLIKKMLKNYKLSRIIFFKSYRFGIKLFGKALLYFLQVFGITHSELMDGFFFSSICLLFFRLVFRLFLFSNPYWYFNLFIFFFGLFIQIKYSPLNRIRIFMVKSLKVLLGKKYWYSYTFAEVAHFQALGYESRLPPINIYHGNIFNWFFRLLFVFFIFFRLIFLYIPIFMFFLIFFVNLFLIFNQYFLFSSFFSFFFFCSKLCFFVTDYNLNDFYNVIKTIEIFDQKRDYIVPNWENAIILSFLAVRSFEFSNYSKTSIYKLYTISGSDFNLIDFYNRFIQYKPLFYKYCLTNGMHGAGLCIEAWVRIERHNHFIKTKGLEGAAYKPVLIVKKIQKNRLHKLIIGVSIFSKIVKTLDQEKKPIINFLQNDLTAFRYVNGDTNWFSKQFFNVPNIITMHPTLGLYIKNVGISVFNKTTYKFTSKNTLLSPYPENGTGRSIVRSATIKPIKEHQSHKIDDLITTLYNEKKIQPVTLEKDFFLHFLPSQNPEIISDNIILSGFFKSFTNNQYKHLLLPDAINCMFTYLTPFSTKEQAIAGLETAIEYFSIMLTKDMPPEQFNMYFKILHNLKKCLTEINLIDNSLFSTVKYPYVEIKTFILKEINNDLQKSNDLPLISIQKTLQRLFPDVVDVTLKHVNNADKIAKERGGANANKYVYKHLLEKGELNVINQNKPPPEWWV